MNYPVSVRGLAAFTAKLGDLDLRFTPAPSAIDGIRGHQAVTAKRAAHWQPEVSLSLVCQGIELSGRCDLWSSEVGRVEEIKTHRVPIERIPDNHCALHWAQAKLYGAMLCEAQGLSQIEVGVLYYHVVSGEETLQSERFSASDLATFVKVSCQSFRAWAEMELAHRRRRDAFSTGLNFPYPSFRVGQYELARGVYTAISNGASQLAQATTGIGKTLATLFPAVKQMARGELDRVFFLTAKTPGRALALDAADRLSGRGEQPLRVLELVARDKACEHPDKACHGDSCPLAQGFYDRLPLARVEAAQARWLDRERVREIALAYRVCPYYLAQEMSQWCDVVIGDYNYYFDAQALLHARTLESGWRAVVLVDEAHNLVERARAMYSVVLDQAVLEASAAQAPSALRGAFKALMPAWENSFARQTAARAYYHEIPEALLKALQNLVSKVTDFLGDAAIRHDGPYMQFYFEALAFIRLADVFADHSVLEVTLDESDALNVRTQIAIRNLIPSPHLAPRFANAVSSTLFSATLSPPEYHRGMLGLGEQTRVLDVPSPFDPSQLRVVIPPGLSTRYSDRANSLGPIAEQIIAQCDSEPGNYLVFASSYHYLQELHAAVQQRAPALATQCQTAGMSEDQRSEFLAHFSEVSQILGFAVLGGAFGEGVDLPGRRLIGAFITTMGMPANEPLTELLRERIDQNNQQGFDYAYRYPGLQKVVQAAGRVVRTLTDTGVIYLLDDRYRRHENRRLLPSWWRIEGP
ncbi:ATP-dependent DNA helicase [Litorivicinus lipolyticus]|uniref:ATP-dependent DNA helicase n=1 Tax=Litorivicinus lipolyticus TaxID=418701 RepID=A0A5Q2QDN1_9GAMM|nr:ATP-dependent DNA helicase [Litorivicinus lipolyticus]QGG80136.1 ATP-dependent DNA helicase [Litorivicinus lipolyticus]